MLVSAMATEPSIHFHTSHTFQVAYLQMYGKTLEHDIKGDTSGLTEKFFLALINVGVWVGVWGGGMAQKAVLTAEIFVGEGSSIDLSTHVWSSDLCT